MPYREVLNGLRPDSRFPDDELAWIAVEEALDALEEGNFGVGATIADRSGNVIVRGHNRVFVPNFRSDLHAEMDALNKYEALGAPDPGGCVCVTSLECCPMCMLRLIGSGIGRVLYLAEDRPGGMVHLREHLPDAWRRLSERQRWEPARCSPELISLAADIFYSTADELYQRLEQRTENVPSQ